MIHFNVFRYEHLFYDKDEHNFKIEMYHKDYLCHGNEFITVTLNEAYYNVKIEKN